MVPTSAPFEFFSIGYSILTPHKLSDAVLQQLLMLKTYSSVA